MRRHEPRPTSAARAKRRGIVLAAGLSSRLYPRTLAQPKCMLELAAGVTILDRQLDQLRALGCDDVTVVTGFEARVLETHVGARARLRHYPGFATHGNLHTLHQVRDLLTYAVLITFADVVAASASWRDVAEAPGDFNLLVDEEHSLPGTMRVRREGTRVVDLGPHIPVAAGHGSFVGLASFSARAAHVLSERLTLMADDPAWTHGIYTDALASLVRSGETLHSIATRGAPWVEVDDESDYAAALLMESRSRT